MIDGQDKAAGLRQPVLAANARRLAGPQASMGHPADLATGEGLDQQG
jgi:hypothetical protein